MMFDLDAIRKRHADLAPLHAEHLRIGWRSHLEIGQLIHEVDRLTLLVQTLNNADPRLNHVRERTRDA